LIERTTGRPGDTVLSGQFQQRAHGGIGCDADRVSDNAAFVFLDGTDFARLIFDAHALVDDADAAFLCHGDGQAGLGDGIHCGGNQRNIERDAARQAGLQIDLVGQDKRMGGNQQNVVKREGFFNNSQHSDYLKLH
jgi:hypothetical protein